MSRPSVWLIVAGATVLLLALVLLWKSTRSGAVEMHATGSARATAPTGGTATPTGPTPAPTGPATRVGRRPARTAPAGIPSPSSPRPSESAPAMPESSDDAPPATRGNTKNLHFGGPQLRAQAAAVEPLVRACVEKAMVAGAHPTGTALLTYVVAQRGDKVEVEDTGFDSEKTTLKQDALVECLHQTAKGMKFEGLPREAEGLYVTRSITLENGAISEYKHVGFSYLR